MKLYQIFQLCILFLNLLNVNGLVNNGKHKVSQNIKYNKLVLKDNNIESTPISPREYILNVGTALEVLHRELPFLFVLESPNFDIFSSHIMVISENGNRINMSKHMYIASVKSMQLAGSFSIKRPLINVRKIEYVEETKMIQCLVEIVLPELIKSGSKNIWEGNFYFGINENGLINSHHFDRKIDNSDSELKYADQEPPWMKPVQKPREKWSICYKFKSLIKIIRFQSIIPTFLLCFSGGWIMNPSLSNLIKTPAFIVSVVNTLLIMSASMVINDIYDIEVDKINTPNRPLITGEVKLKEAYLLSFFLLGTSEYLTFRYLPSNLQFIIQIAIGKVILYTPVLKRIFFIKNLSCAGLVSFSIFFNGLAVSSNNLMTTNKNFGLLSIALSLVFFGSWSNELMLDMRDVEGDKNNNIVTVPTVFGKDFSWLLIYIINNYNIISNSLSVAYLYNSSGLGSGIVLILSPLLVNLYKVKTARYSFESIKDYTQKSNYPLLVLMIYLCALAYAYK